MALADVALRIGQHPRNQPADRVRHGQRRDFSSGEHKIAQRDFFIHAGLDKALIDALVVAADQDKMIKVPLQPPGGLLRKGLSLRGEIDHPPACFRFGEHGVQAGFQRLGHHDAAEASSIGVIIHLALPVFGIVPDLGTSEIQDSLFCSAAKNALMEHRVHRVRKKRQDIHP